MPAPAPLNYEYNQVTFTWSRNDPVIKHTLQGQTLTIAPKEPRFLNLGLGTIVRMKHLTDGETQVLAIVVGIAPHLEFKGDYNPIEFNIEDKKLTGYGTFFVTVSPNPRDVDCRGCDCGHHVFDVPDEVDEVVIVLKKPIIQSTYGGEVVK